MANADTEGAATPPSAPAVLPPTATATASTEATEATPTSEREGGSGEREGVGPSTTSATAS